MINQHYLPLKMITDTIKDDQPKTRIPMIIILFALITRSSSYSSSGLYPVTTRPFSKISQSALNNSPHHQTIIKSGTAFRRRVPLISHKGGSVFTSPSVVSPRQSKGKHDTSRRGKEQNDGDDVSQPPKKKLDHVLSRLTSFFPFFVLGSAILGIFKPSALVWVNNGELITVMLAMVMMGTGMTLEKKDFGNVLADNFSAIPVGVLCQFITMPLTAFVIGRSLLLGVNPALFLGLVLVGCSPGGTASNLVSLIAGADVALSVLLTTASTVLASVVTPILVKLLVGKTVSISGMALCRATTQVVLLPVVLGMLFNSKFPEVCRQLSRITPFASAILVALICGGVVSQNAASLVGGGVAKDMLPIVVVSVLALHMIGFTVGFFVPRLGFGFSERSSRTISIETGMQNSALAVVLARSVGADALASLPGALSATVHSCLGSILAIYWRTKDKRKGKDSS